MKMKNWLRRAAAGALCLILCAAGMAQTAMASKKAAVGPIPNFDPYAADYSLTLSCKKQRGVEFRVYRVAGQGRTVHPGEHVLRSDPAKLEHQQRKGELAGPGQGAV